MGICDTGDIINDNRGWTLGHFTRLTGEPNRKTSIYKYKEEGKQLTEMLPGSNTPRGTNHHDQRRVKDTGGFHVGVMRKFQLTAYLPL